MQCLSTNWALFALLVALSLISQILAVLSPEPLAKKSWIGFHAHMKTSDSCPRSTVTLLGAMSVKFSAWLTALSCCTVSLRSDELLLLAKSFGSVVLTSTDISTPAVDVDGFVLFIWFWWLATTSGITASIRLSFSTSLWLLPGVYNANVYNCSTLNLAISLTIFAHRYLSLRELETFLYDRQQGCRRHLKRVWKWNSLEIVAGFSENQTNQSSVDVGLCNVWLVAEDIGGMDES